METINVTKASGEQEPFSEAKVRRLLRGLGAEKQLVEKILPYIREQLYDGISTQKITEEAFHQLRMYSDLTKEQLSLNEPFPGTYKTNKL